MLWWMGATSATGLLSLARELGYSGFGSVDEVRYFDSDESLENLVKEVKPDIIVVGSDWKGKTIIGSYYAAELKFFDRIEEYATTKTIQCIIDRG